jgi:bifunctional non-homologous end joining protein LigD
MGPASRRLLKAGPAGKALRSARVPSAVEPDLFADPMPARIEPCLAQLMPSPPVGPDWLFEVKWDGYRLAIHRDAEGVRIITRGGHDWTHRFPAIEAAALALSSESFILDGEAIVADESGHSSFSLLQQDLGGRGGKAIARNAILYAFDLLYIDGHGISRMSLEERRHMLEDLLDGETGAIRLSKEVEGDGAVFLAQACKLGLEGIIAKRRDAPYRSGRGGEWQKIKCIASEMFLIVGYEPSRIARGGLGALLLAAHGNYGLTYVAMSAPVSPRPQQPTLNVGSTASASTSPQ